MCVVYNCRNFGALLFGTNNRPEGGHDDPEPATDSTLLQKPDLQAHRSPPSGGSIVYLYQGRDWTVMAWDRVQPRSIESEATDVSPNHSPALTATKSRTSTAELPTITKWLPGRARGGSVFQYYGTRERYGRGAGGCS